MSPGRLDILTEALTFVARLIMEARSDRDAESLRNQLKSLGETKRSDVDAVERERRLELMGFDPVDPDQLGTLRRLRQDEPTQASPMEKRRIAPDFHRDPDACQECHRMPCVCDVRPLIGGPLGEGD
jgi:hypothetical protein